MANKVITLLFVSILLCLALPAQAGGAKGVVVWRLVPNEGVDEKDIDIISGFIASQVELHSEGKVISEGDIKTILKGEETRQKCGVNDTSCIAEIGNALGVPEAISGELGKLGSFWMLNLRRINVREAEVIKRSSRNIEGSIDDLIRALPAAVADLFGAEPVEAGAVVGKAPEIASPPGTLIVTTIPPGASIAINGRKLGVSPYSGDLPVGEHAVTATLKGYLNGEGKVTIQSGASSKLNLELLPVQPGSLHIVSQPQGVEIEIDGKSAGVAPLEQALPPGEHTVTAKLEGYNIQTHKVRMKSGEREELRVSMNLYVPPNPQKRWAQITFWSGLLIAAFGGVATWQAADQGEKANSASSSSKLEDYRSASRGWMGGAIAGYSLGGALMITGAVLWFTKPSDEEWERAHGVAVGPMPDGKGVALSFTGRW